MKKLLAITILFLSVFSLTVDASAQRRKKDKQSSDQPADTTAVSQATSFEDKLFNEENLKFFVGPTKHKNIFVKLSQKFVAKRYEDHESTWDMSTNAEGQVVRKRKSDFTISSDVKGQILKWKELGAEGWLDDAVMVSFNLGDGKYAEIWFKFIEKNGDMIAVLDVPEKNKFGGNKFVLGILDGWFMFGAETHNTILIYEEVVEEADDPAEAETIKPGELRGGKEPYQEDRWSNYGVTIGDL